MLGSKSLTNTTSPLCCGLVFVCFTVSVANGADERGLFSVDGPGNSKCAAFTEAFSQKSEAISAYAYWTQGYLSAANRYEDTTFDLTPWQPIELTLSQLNAFCKTNPNTSFLNGLTALVEVLRADRLTEPSEVISLRYNGKSVFLPRATIAKTLEALKAAGHLATIPEDGAFTDRVAAGLLRYQAENELPVTGLPDTLTLNSMFSQPE